jgi:hypothetical protein
MCSAMVIYWVSKLGLQVGKLLGRQVTRSASRQVGDPAGGQVGHWYVGKPRSQAVATDVHTYCTVHDGVLLGSDQPASMPVPC